MFHGCPKIWGYTKPSDLFYDLQHRLENLLEYIWHHLDYVHRPHLSPVVIYDLNIRLDLEETLESTISFMEHCLLPGSIELVLPSRMASYRAQYRRAKQGFGIATDRDLVYIDDEWGCELFLRLWKNPWCKKIERLAILVCGCFSVWPSSWDAEKIDNTAKVVWPDEDNLFSALVGAKLKEFMLVMSVNSTLVHSTECEMRSFPRDDFGFVDYEVFRDRLLTDSSSDYLQGGGDYQLRQGLGALDLKLKNMFSDKLDHDITIRYVVDVGSLHIRTY